MLIIPAIDLKDGKCVRLRQGRAEDVTVFGDDPAAMGLKWQAAGAQLLHVVDLDGAFSSRPQNLDSIRRLRQALSIPIELGGGIRTLDTIAAYIELGIDRLILGTVALKDPDLAARACADYPGRIIFGLDAKDGLLAVEGWTETSQKTALDAAQALAQLIARGLHLHRHRPGRGQTRGEYPGHPGPGRGRGHPGDRLRRGELPRRYPRPPAPGGPGGDGGHHRPGLV